MPITRLLKASILLSWILLLLYLLTMDLHKYQVFSIVALTGGCISWGFTLFYLMKQGGVFDEQSFHRTRPMGDRIVFRRHCCIIVCFCALMMCAMIFRGIYYHLGVYSTLLGVFMIGLLSVFFSTSLSTGFTIYLAQSRRKHWALTLMVYLPITTYLLIMGGVIRTPSNLYFSPVIGGFVIITHGLLAASLCSMLAWFFVAKTRRWWTGVILILLAMLLLPFHILPRYLQDTQTTIAQSQLPETFLRMRTTIPKFDRFSTISGTNFLSFDGLKENEYAQLSFIFDIHDPNFPSQLKDDFHNIERLSQHRISFSAYDQYENSPTTYTPELKMIRSIYAHCIVDQGNSRQNYYDLGGNDRFPLNTATLYIEMFQNCKWRCIVQITEMTKLTSLPRLTGGRISLPEGGVIKVSAPHLKDGSYYFSSETVTPWIKTQNVYATFEYYYRNPTDYILLLVNSQESKVVTMEHHTDKTSQKFGMISSLHQHTIDRSLLSDWTEADLQGARVHILKRSVRNVFKSDNSLLKVE